MDEFLSIKGRLRRREYFLRTLFLIFGITFLALKLEDYEVSLFDNLIISFGILLMSILLIIQDIKRLHDMNFSGWFWLINLIPLINLLFLAFLLLNPGTYGSNRFGEDPRTYQ